MPHDNFKFVLDVYALPDGLTPSGCLRTSVVFSVSQSRLEAAACVFSLFTGLESSSIGPLWVMLRIAVGTVMTTRSK